MTGDCHLGKDIFKNFKYGGQPLNFKFENVGPADTETKNILCFKLEH